MTRITALIVTISLSFHFSFSQDTWDLQKCVDYALENNIDIKTLNLNVDKQENYLTYQKAQVLPNANAGLSHTYSKSGRNPSNYDYTNDAFYSGSMNLSTGVNVFRGFDNYFAIKQMKYSVKTALANVDELSFNISLNVAAYFYQVQYNREVLNLLKNQHELVKIELEKTKSLVEGGVLAYGDQLEMEAQLSQLDLDIVNAQNNLDLSYLDLKQLLNIPQEEAFVLGELDVSAFENADSMQVDYSAIEQNYPSILAAQYTLETSEFVLKRSKSGYYPSLSIGAGLGTWYNELSMQTQSFSNQLDANLNSYYSLSLSVPIFNRLGTKTQVRNASLDMQQAKYALEAEKLQLRKIIEKARLDYLAASKKYTATIATLSAEKEGFRYIREKYHAGVASATDFKLAQQNLMLTESQLLQAQYEMIMRSDILNFYINRVF